jgi:DNA primase
MISSPIDEIKSRLDIIEVIGSYIKLHKAGANYRAICPFHSEKKPSFFVSPARQIWHCFGCNSGGDIFRFVMRIEGVEFGDALRILAQKAGVELRPVKPELRTERQRLLEICELSTQFFEKQLESKIGQEVKEYLLNRGIKEESIKKWRLGYAPDTWQGLSDFLLSKKYQKEEIAKAGLAIKNEEGRFYDRFRGRIMFPVFDLNSQIVGFGGRVFGKNKSEASEEMKYINTPNTLLYDKSRILYGLDKAKIAIRQKDFCILVEGYTDVILSNQVGFENVVSTSGTALTPFQLKILKRYSENLFTCFDMDVAGDSATKRGIDLAQIQGFNIKVVTLPENLDPADVISKDSKEFEKLIEKALSILDFYFQNAFSRFDKKTPGGKKEISKILLRVLKRIPNKIEQSFWIQKLAKELEVKEENVVEELKKIKLEEETYGLEQEEVENLPPKTRKELLEERLLMLIVRNPQNMNLIEENILLDFKDDIPCFSKKSVEILTNLKKELNFPLENLSPEALDFFNYISLKSEIEEIDEKEVIKEAGICLKEIQSLEIKNKLNEISKEIKKAEEQKSPETQKLLEEFNSYSKTLRDLEDRI